MQLQSFLISQDSVLSLLRASFSLSIFVDWQTCGAPKKHAFSEQLFSVEEKCDEPQDTSGHKRKNSTLLRVSFFLAQKQIERSGGKWQKIKESFLLARFPSREFLYRESIELRLKEENNFLFYTPDFSFMFQRPIIKGPKMIIS